MEDASGFQGIPDRVLSPTSAEEVSQILIEAAASDIPVTVAGALTGVTGAGVAQRGWSVSLSKLNDLEILPGRSISGAGVLLKDLHGAASSRGQFYAPDPTEDTASVGGTIATNASGSRSFRYGATRRHVHALLVALMDGSLRWYRRGEAIDFEVPEISLPATTKNTAGYLLHPGMDWVDLFTGSEGTLGVVCQAELSLLPEVSDLLTGVIFFEGQRERAAVRAVESWRALPGLRMLEYLDANSLALLRDSYPGIPAEARACLLIEQEKGDADQWVSLIEGAGADLEGSWFAATPSDRERFRRFRHALPERINQRVRLNGFQKLGSDYAVPLSRNADMLALYHHTLENHFPGRYAVFGHIGDAHVHANILPESQHDYDHGRHIMLELAREAVLMGGTVSAEHGLGKRKAHLLQLQYSPREIEAMKAVKRRLDPLRLLGQGNLFGSEDRDDGVC
jgi:FAD/FMN-containing dehydrogenase